MNLGSYKTCDSFFHKGCLGYLDYLRITLLGVA
jgi:hypothetical protein